MNYGHDLLYLGYIYLFVLDFFTGSDSIQGTWCKDILQTIMSFTPHNWASHTLSCFPGPLQVILFELYIECTVYEIILPIYCVILESFDDIQRKLAFVSSCESFLLLPKSLELFLVLLKDQMCL